MNADTERQPDLELPLLELFYRLREADLPLGTAEYELLPKALLAGFGFDGLDSLKRLCQMLWIKTPDEKAIFEHVFTQYLAERPAAIQPEPVDQTGKKETEEDRAARRQERADDEAGTPEGERRRKDVRIPAGDKTKDEAAVDEDRDKATRRIERQTARPDTTKMARREPARRPIDKPILERASTQTYDEATHFVIAGGGQVSRGTHERRYRFKADYLPITKRQMKQSWRYLRKSVREGPPVEFDVEATVDKVAAEGRLYEAVMVPRRVNRAAMVLLLDQEGSMAPFHGFSRRLEETAVRGGRLGQTNVYFFNNYPLNVLYCNPYFNESRPLETVLGELHPTRTAVLIFSDAGAARNRYSYERVDMTRAFLKRLQQSVRYVAWLNPMPAYRWPNTSAAAIARTVPMFEVSREGLQNAISVLRGRTIPRR